MAVIRSLMADALPVTEGILAAAKLDPDSFALSYVNQHLTYAELDRKSALFGAYMAQRGVKPGDAVAICLERSFDWIIAALGIMRAGAAYVPLDPAWPDARKRFVWEDSASTALVARSALLNHLQLTAAGVDPLRDHESIAASPAFAHAPVNLESLAYIIYTAGSTGTLKGVEITHANLVHLTRWHRNAFNVRPGDCASHLAGLGFDATAWELWPNLCAGATICLAEETVVSSALLIKNWLIRDRVTISFVPPAHAASLMSMEWPATTALRFMLAGGDVLHQGPPRGLPFEVVNHYGATECTVVATCALLQPGAPGRPSIGRPITGATIYLLDERGERVADGLSGEIYIGGDGVGRGYRHQPKSTAQCFVFDRFSEEPGKRLYRTGDYGTRRPDGEIEFLGHSGKPVTIRGQRIELDKIGSALSRHPAVEFATAIFKTATGGENHLVAYVLPKEDSYVPGSAELQTYLQGDLPDYMIPSVFMELHSLPLSHSAKMETKQKEQPGNITPLNRTTTTVVAPPVAGRLLEMFQEMLHHPAMTMDDNFFQGGGDHSLLGMQLVNRLRVLFDLELTLQEILAAPTVISLAPLAIARWHESRLTVIWESLLSQKHISLDDDFFACGGDVTVLPALQQRIAGEFGRHLTETDFLENPTIRRQAMLIQRDAENTAVPPPGVFVLHHKKTRHNIFWIHNPLSILVAKELGDDQPCALVTLTPRDVALLGEAPAMKDIAAHILRKILTTQPKGPYTIAGICIGGVVAYEVASQLRAAGEEVSILFMIDAPTQPYVTLSTAWITRLKHPGFYLHRAAAVIGWRSSLANLWERATQHAPGLNPSRFRIFEKHSAHQMIMNAAHDYHPARYDGKTMLLLAKERDPLFNFLPAWQSLINNLEAFYVPGRHRDVITSSSVREVANLIRSGLNEYPAPDDSSVDMNAWAAGA